MTTCWPSANTENSRRKREKPLLPRVVRTGMKVLRTRPTSLSADTGSRGKNERHYGAGINREGPSTSM